MTVLAVGSVKASPGATTSVVALAAVWPTGRDVVIVEADPDGGVLAARSGLQPELGLSTLAAAGRHRVTASDLTHHTQTLPGGVDVLLGPLTAGEAARSLEVVAGNLASLLASDLPLDVLIDCGRIRPGSPALALVEVASRVVLVAHPRLDELHGVSALVRQLTDEGQQVELLLIGERPYGSADVEQAVGVRATALADDPRTAAAFAGQVEFPGRVDRSALIRSARSVIERVVADADGTTTPGRTSAQPSPGAEATGGEDGSHLGARAPSPIGPRP